MRLRLASAALSGPEAWQATPVVGLIIVNGVFQMITGEEGLSIDAMLLDNRLPFFNPSTYEQ